MTATEPSHPLAETFISPGCFDFTEKRNWDDEFRPAPAARTESIPLETGTRPRRPHWGSLQFLEAQRQLEHSNGLMWDPLTNRDADLFKHETPAQDWFVAEPKHESLRKTVLRVYSLFHIENQRPGSRAELYTRWFGEQRLRNMLSDEAVAAIAQHQLENRQVFFTGVGFFGGN